MSSATETSEQPAAGLRRLAALPGWLEAALRPERVIEALERHVAEFAAGDLKIRRCKADLRLKGTYWDAHYELTVEGLDRQPGRKALLCGTLTPPGIERAEQASGGAFGSVEWRCYLPELRLDLRMDSDEEEFEALPLLTDAAQARAFLERSIRASAPAYSGIRIRACTPNVMRNKPGRCTVLYEPEYDGEPAARNWPGLIVAKTYSHDKGQDTFEAMRKLWATRLSSGEVVTIAEPLAYVPEHKVLVQGPVRGEQDLKDMLRSALRAGTPQALEELHQVVRKTAAGLAALHHSGARHGETVTWQDELAEIREEQESLRRVLPWFAEATEPLLTRLESLAAGAPADETLPAHRSFRPQQVLVHQGQVGFIDFDGFCLAEPALDIALFRATAKELGINTSPSDKQKDFEYPSAEARLARLAQLDAICDIFLAEYERLAPVSRRRVALWEALDLLTVVLRCWTKVKPHQLSNAMLMLEQHLERSVVSSQ